MYETTIRYAGPQRPQSSVTIPQFVIPQNNNDSVMIRYAGPQRPQS